MSMGVSSSAELRAFEATARTGSMSGAARLLGLSQPTISAHIASLEQRFGVELFHRRGRGVVLTEFGALLHEATHRIRRAEEEAELLLLVCSGQISTVESDTPLRGPDRCVQFGNGWGVRARL